MLDDPKLLEYDTQDLHTQLVHLGKSYQGLEKAFGAPYAAVGFLEGGVPVRLSPFIERSVVSSGTQFILGDVLNPDARDIAHIAEASGAEVVNVGTASQLEGLTMLVPSQPLAPYTYLQFLAYGTNHSAEALEASNVVEELATQCNMAIPTEQNEAKQIAWKLWGRTPLLLASEDFKAQIGAWQQLLGRIGKSMSIPLEHEPLITLSGAFEARHDFGDGLVGLVLGEINPETTLLEEVLSTRVDETIYVTAPEHLSEHAKQVYIWTLGAWVAFYLALSYKQNPSDGKVMQVLNHELNPAPDDAELN